MNSLERRIYKLLSQISTEKNIGTGDDLFSLGILDSLSMARLIPAIEKEFNIEIDVEDILPENFMSIQDIVRFISRWDEVK